jgi:hypothetical protein
MMTVIHCPQCNAEVGIKNNSNMIFSCQYCLSSIVLENDSTALERLIKLKQSVDIRSNSYRAVDFSLYHCEVGTRIEWQMLNKQNEAYILTEDDENFSLVTAINIHLDKALNWNSLLVNTQVNLNNTNWLVTEKRLMKNSLGQQFKYSYLTAENAELLVIIFTQNHITYRKGFWFDPFELRHES